MMADMELTEEFPQEMEASEFIEKRRPGRKKKPVSDCQLCGVHLASHRHYYQRYRICVECSGLRSVLLDGKHQRFCQQCGRFHDLNLFEGTLKTCRERLDRHAARRRKSINDNGGTIKARPARRNSSPGLEGSDEPPIPRQREDQRPSRISQAPKRFSSPDLPEDSGPLVRPKALRVSPVDGFSGGVAHSSQRSEPHIAHRSRIDMLLATLESAGSEGNDDVRRSQQQQQQQQQQDVTGLSFSRGFAAPPLPPPPSGTHMQNGRMYAAPPRPPQVGYQTEGFAPMHAFQSGLPGSFNGLRPQAALPLIPPPPPSVQLNNAPPVAGQFHLSSTLQALLMAKTNGQPQDAAPRGIGWDTGVTQPSVNQNVLPPPPPSTAAAAVTAVPPGNASEPQAPPPPAAEGQPPAGGFINSQWQLLEQLVRLGVSPEVPTDQRESVLSMALSLVANIKGYQEPGQG